MRDLGQTLRERREELGMSLDDLVTMTKIRKRYLSALEEGDWSQLPGDVYARGFVRSYADHLGLDGSALLEQYAGETTGVPHGEKQADDRRKGQPQDPANASSNRASRSSGDEVPLGLSALRPAVKKLSQASRTKAVRPRASTMRHHRPARGIVGQVAAVVGILVILGGGLWVLHHDQHTTAKSPMTPSGVAGTMGSGSGAKRQGSKSHEVGGSGSANQPVAAQGKSRSTRQKGTEGGAGANTTGGGPTASSVTVVSAPIVQGNQVLYSVSTNAPLSVDLHASSRLWTAVTADGTSVDGAGGEIIAQGQMKPFTANKEISFVIGNVPAASFTVNGQAVALPSVNRTITVMFTVTSPSSGKH